MENVEDMVIEPNRPGPDCLDIPEVMRTVFQNLPSADCLNLSRVNRVWHYEAQCVLRDRGIFTAEMNTDDGRCKDLRAFAADLRRMRGVRNVVPFSGLTIAIGGADDQHGDWCEESYSGELDQVYEDIVHQMEWRHLVLRLSHLWDRRKNCAGLQLVKKILHSCSRVLEEFSLNIASDHEAFNHHTLGDCKFSHLKTLDFLGSSYFEIHCTGLIKTLVSRAPNLKVLYTKDRMDLRANLLEGSAAVHVTDYPYQFPGDAIDIPESIVGQLRLQKLQLSLGLEDFNFERFNRIIPMLLQNSRTTLSWMEVDAMFLVPLMHYGIYLENVRVLRVILHDSDFCQPRSRRLLKSFDFSSVFPNVSEVRIDHDESSNLNDEHARNALIDMVERRNTPLIEPVNRSVNIKQLYLWGGCQESCVRFLVEILPHIEKIFIEAIGAPFVRFWDYWLDLEELDIRLELIPDVVENLDSAFCGIFPEEVAELRERDEEYLRNVEIVPVMPSLSCLKRLRTFRLFFDDRMASSSLDPTSKLTKVTGRIAFKRCPHLTVTLETNSARWNRELQQHMEPYASVLLDH